MIISHKHRFIFIKTRKTAGTSIEVFLSPFCGPRDIVTPIAPPVPGHVPRNHGSLVNHLDARTLRSALPPEIWASYYTFCVERNPWDKTLSHYYSRKARFHDGELELDDYLRQGRFALNAPLYSDGGRIIVDRVVRYENLTEEMAEVFGRIGIPFDGSLGVRAKSHYRSERRPYQHIYTPRQRTIVERIFTDEIALHGYDFDAGPPAAEPEAVRRSAAA